MNHAAAERCRTDLVELWALWPRTEIPSALAARLDACPACREEKAAFAALGARSRPWSEALPARRRRRAADAVKRALTVRTAPRPAVWAPAFAFAAALLVVLWSYRVPDVTVAPWRAAPPPRELLERRDLLEHLDLLQNWDQVRALAGEARDDLLGAGVLPLYGAGAGADGRGGSRRGLERASGAEASGASARLRALAGAEPERRALLERRYEEYRALGPEKRAALDAAAARLSTLSPERRRQLTTPRAPAPAPRPIVRPAMPAPAPTPAPRPVSAAWAALHARADAAVGAVAGDRGRVKSARADVAKSLNDCLRAISTYGEDSAQAAAAESRLAADLDVLSKDVDDAARTRAAQLERENAREEREERDRRDEGRR